MKCGNCGSEYLPELTSCPYCGFSKNSFDAQPDEEIKEREKRATFAFIFGWCSVLLPILYIFTIIFSVLSYNKQSVTPLLPKAKWGIVVGGIAVLANIIFGLLFN